MNGSPDWNSRSHLSETEPIDSAEGVSLQVALLTADIATVFAALAAVDRRLRRLSRQISRIKERERKQLRRKV